MIPKEYSLPTVDIANTAAGVPVFVYKHPDAQTVTPAEIGAKFTDQAGQLWLATPAGWLPAAPENQVERTESAPDGWLAPRPV